MQNSQMQLTKLSQSWLEKSFNSTIFQKLSPRQRVQDLKTKKIVPTSSLWQILPSLEVLSSTRSLARTLKVSSKLFADTMNSTFCTLLWPKDGQVALSLASRKNKFLEIKKTDLLKNADHYLTDSFASAQNSVLSSKVKNSRYFRAKPAKLVTRLKSSSLKLLLKSLINTDFASKLVKIRITVKLQDIEKRLTSSRLSWPKLS